MTHKEAIKICEQEAPTNDPISRSGWMDALEFLEKNPDAEYQMPENYTRYDESFMDCVNYFKELLVGDEDQI